MFYKSTQANRGKGWRDKVLLPKVFVNCTWDLEYGNWCPIFFPSYSFSFPSCREISPSSYLCSLSGSFLCAVRRYSCRMWPPLLHLCPSAGFGKGITMERKREAKERSGSRCLWVCVQLELTLVQHQAKVAAGTESHSCGNLQDLGCRQRKAVVLGQESQLPSNTLSSFMPLLGLCAAG